VRGLCVRKPFIPEVRRAHSVITVRDCSRMYCNT
jgi:hypothetical protein